MKKIFLTVIALSLVLVGCGSNDETKLKVGIDCDYAPHSWTTTKDKATEYAQQIENSDAYCDGYDVWIAQELATKTNRELEIYKTSWDGLIPALQSGTVDIAIAGMNPTEERKQSINFSDPYYNSDGADYIVTKKDGKFSNATSIADFSGANVSAQLGTIQYNLLPQLIGAEVKPAMDDYNSLIQGIKSETLDAYVVDRVVALEQVAANKDDLTYFYFEGENGFEIDESTNITSVGLSKESTELLKEINTALSTITEDMRNDKMNYFTDKE